MNFFRSAVVVAVVLSGCGTVVHGSGTAKSDQRDVSAYQHLAVEDALQVELTDRDVATLSVNGDDNLVQYITTDVESDGTLHVRVKDHVLLDSKTPLSIEVGRASVSDINVSGDSLVHSDLGITCDAVGLHASGSSKIDLGSVSGGSLAVEASGASHVCAHTVSTPKGTFDLSGASEVLFDIGNVDTLTVSASGASHFDVEAITSQTASVDVSGASEVELQASQSITGDASGASQVTVGGNPSTRSVSTSGGSSVGFQ
jgi:hypothetical protein